MSNEDLKKLLDELLILPKETEWVEFKEAKRNFDFKDLGKYFSALSNEANLKDKKNAWLIFGVQDNPRQVIGTKFRPRRADLDSLKSEIANKTTAGLTFLEIYELNLSEGRVVMFEIPPAPKGIPIGWEGHFYGRDDEVLCPLNIQEIESIRQQNILNDWSYQICEGAAIGDLDPGAILQARKNYKQKNPSKSLESDTWDDRTFLNKAKLTRNGAITNTAILLLGKESSAHFLSQLLPKSLGY